MHAATDRVQGWNETLYCVVQLIDDGAITPAPALSRTGRAPVRHAQGYVDRQYPTRTIANMETRPAPRRRAPVLLTAVTLAISTFASAAAVITISGPERPQLSASQIVALCNSQVYCLADRFTEGMDSIVTDVARIPELADLANVSCHSVSHAVGERAFSRFGDEVFKVYEPRCGSGFTHGWMVSYAKSLTEGRDISAYNALRLYCDKAPERQTCLHGVGHSLATASSGGGTASEVCRLIAGEGGTAVMRGRAETCIEGFAMEFGFDIEAVARIIDPAVSAAEVCGSVGSELRQYCTSIMYRGWTEESLEYRSERFEVFAAACAALDGYDREVCFMELGESLVVVLGEPKHPVGEQIAATNRFCAGSPVMCVMSQVSVMANKLDDPAARITALCAGLRPALRKVCALPDRFRTEGDIK